MMFPTPCSECVNLRADLARLRAENEAQQAEITRLTERNRALETLHHGVEIILAAYDSCPDEDDTEDPEEFMDKLEAWYSAMRDLRSVFAACAPAPVEPPCADCGGDGMTLRGDDDGNAYRVPCDKCDGTGYAVSFTGKGFGSVPCDCRKEAKE